MAATNIIACYVRCSTEEQNEASQKREIQRYLNVEGIDPARVRWFIDKATGDNLDREQFKALDKLIRKGAVRRVIVWKIDRLSRRMLDGMTVLSKWLKAGVRFSCVTLDIDFGGVYGEMLAALLWGFAQLEQRHRKERQRAGIDTIMADPQLRREKYPGRQPESFKAKPEEANKLRSKGLTYPQIASAMGISQSTVRRYLGAV